MSNVTSGWRKAAVFTSSVKAFIPFITTEDSDYTPEIVQKEITDGALYGGRNLSLAIGYTEDSIISTLNDWMKANTPVSVAIASNGLNILTGQLRTEPIRNRITGGFNARDGLRHSVVELSVIEPIDSVHEAKNLAYINSNTSLGAGGSFTVVFPISSITYGFSASLNGNLTLTIKDVSGATLATSTVSSAGGVASGTLLAPAGAWSVQLTASASATDVCLRTDGETEFVNH